MELRGKPVRYRRCARNCEPGAPNQHVTGQALHWVAPGRRFEGVDRQARRPAVASFVRGRLQPSGTGKFFSEVTTARPVSGVAAHFEQRRAICRVDHAGTGASAWAGFGYCNENRILFVRRGIGRGSVFDRRVRARRRSSAPVRRPSHLTRAAPPRRPRLLHYRTAAASRFVRALAPRSSRCRNSPTNYSAARRLPT